MAVRQCIKYEERLLSLLLSPHVPVPGKGERGHAFWATARAGGHGAGLTAGRRSSKEGQLSPNSSCRHGVHVRPRLPWASPLAHI